MLQLCNFGKILNTANAVCIVCVLAIPLACITQSCTWKINYHWYYWKFHLHCLLQWQFDSLMEQSWETVGRLAFHHMKKKTNSSQLKCFGTSSFCPSVSHYTINKVMTTRLYCYYSMKLRLCRVMITLLSASVVKWTFIRHPLFSGLWKVQATCKWWRIASAYNLWCVLSCPFIVILFHTEAIKFCLFLWFPQVSMQSLLCALLS